MSTPLEARQYIQDLMLQYRVARVVMTCTELGLFAALHHHPQTAVDLSHQLNINPAVLRRLLNAAMAVKLLEKQENVYSNSDIAAACLAEEGPFYLGHLVRREAAIYRRWSYLTQAMKTGERVPYDDGDKDWVRPYQLSLYDAARENAPIVAEELASLLPDDSPVQILDLGGGHGLYSIVLAQQIPQAHITILDMPFVVPLTAELIDKNGVADQVTAQGGDFFTDAFTTANDFILFFCAVVAVDEGSKVQSLFQKIYDALKPGGWLVVGGSYLDDDRTQPLKSVMFDIQRLLSAGLNRAYTLADITTFVMEMGFRQPIVVDRPELDHWRMILAQKPE